MKLPQIQYGRVSAPNAQRNPYEAVREHESKQQMLNTATRVGEAIAEQKVRADQVKANATYRDAVTNFELDIQGRDEITREELEELGIDPGRFSGEKRVDEQGNETEVFRRYAVEPAMMGQFMRDRLTEASEVIGDPRARQHFVDTHIGDIDQQVLRLNDEAARKAKETEYRLALADLEALNNNPTAQRELAQEHPALADHPEVRQRYINQAKASEYEMEANAMIYNSSDQELEAFEKQLADGEYRAGLPVNDREAQIFQNRARAEIKRRKQAEMAYIAESRAERERIAKDTFSSVKAAYESGMPIPDEDMDLARGRVAGTPYEDSLAMMQEVSNFSVMPAADQLEKMQSLSGLEDAKEYQALAGEYARVQKGIRQDGYAFAVQQGLVPYEPIDPTNPDSWQFRQMQAAEISEHYGVAVSPLTQPEVDFISQQLGAMTVDQKVEAAMTFADTPAVWSQFDKSGQTVFALVGASGDRELARTALQGQKLIDSDQAILPSEKEYLLETNDYLADVYGPADKRAVMDSALAVYAARSPTGKDGEFDTDLWKQSLAAVTGGIDTVNGFKVQLPRNTDVDTMQAYIDGFSAEDVRAAGGTDLMSDEDAALLIQEGRWKSVGNDRYVVEVGNGGVLMTPPRPGQPSRPMIITYGENEALNTQAREAARLRQLPTIKLTGSDRPKPEHFMYQP